jgi:bis(5'-nucleosyl)-tetraphosphatase (symmetrical)
MAVYAIGDVQGCFSALQALLRKLAFDGAHDTLWFTGDLVNRGPQSLEVLRFVAGLGERAITVLGNHDLHLLAVACSAAARRRRDSFGDVLTAPDRGQLLSWLRRQPLLHHDAELGYTLVHAGLLPQWDLAQARVLAGEVERALRGSSYVELLERMYGDQPDKWDDTLSGWERLRLAVNAFTRLRYCTVDGRMELAPVGVPGSQPSHLLPWFQAPQRRTRMLTVIFGHWSTLGAWQGDGVIALDSGCVWGRSLTAVRLDGREHEFVSVACEQKQAPC